MKIEIKKEVVYISEVNKDLNNTIIVNGKKVNSVFGLEEFKKIASLLTNKTDLIRFIFIMSFVVETQEYLNFYTWGFRDVRNSKINSTVSFNFATLSCTLRFNINKSIKIVRIVSSNFYNINPMEMVQKLKQSLLVVEYLMRDLKKVHKYFNTLDKAKMNLINL